MHFRIPRPRLSSAHAIALVALFVALGGSAYAATVITGEHVQDASLSGRDLAADSLNGREVTNLDTRDVADGGLLAQDFRRGELPSGELPRAYSTGRGFASIGIDGEEIGSLDVPAGTYLFTSHTGIESTGGDDMLGECSIATAGGTIIAQQSASVGGSVPAYRNQISMSKIAATPAGKVTLTCRRYYSLTNAMTLRNAAFNAVPVGAVLK